jgi:hypothetical protein
MIQEQFVGEPIEPVASTFDSARMARGEPGLPREFTWRELTIRVVEVRRSWNESGPCRHGSGEQYVRKHWYEVLTESDGVMLIYFQRTMKKSRNSARWWLFSIMGPDTSGKGGTP